MHNDKALRVLEDMMAYLELHDRTERTLKLRRDIREVYAASLATASEVNFLTCSTCSVPMEETALPAAKAWCSDGCYQHRKTDLSDLADRPMPPVRDPYKKKRGLGLIVDEEV